MAIRVLEETGLLPHLNPGVMSWEEMNRLKPVSPSMGMMLETTSRRLFETKGEAHYGSPDKDPDLRVRVLEDAGRLSVPFTTGLLIGIGENLTERAESIFELRRVARQYGHVQEVIIQNFRAKPDTAMRHVDDLGLEDYLAAIAVSRIVLGPRIRLQAPPNLVDLRTGVPRAARRRRRRLGRGLPAHPRPREPRTTVALAGAAARDHRRRRLRAACPPHRAPGVRPRRRALDRPPGLRARRRPRRRRRAGQPGHRAGEQRPAGLPWQEPDGGFAGVGRTDLHAGGRHRGPHRRPALATSTTSTATGTRSRRGSRRG